MKLLTEHPTPYSRCVQDSLRPEFSRNGNRLYHTTVERCLEELQAEAIGVTIEACDVLTTIAALREAADKLQMYFDSGYRFTSGFAARVEVYLVDLVED